MRPTTRAAASLAAVAACAAALEAATVTGRVRVQGRAAGASVPTIVYAEPLDARAPARPGRFTLTQRDKRFVPHVLAVPAGSTVEFPNKDDIFHNVFSLSKPAPFDLGLYRAGASRSRVFAEPAAYRVFCNIHPEMTAVILVAPSPYLTEADAAGAFRLELPPGRYRLTAWSERAQPASVEVAVGPAAAAADLALDESGFVELPHRNKFGQEYPKTGYDPLRDRKTK